MRQMMFALGIMAAVTSSGCTNNSNSSSLPAGPTPNLVTETFNGSITQGTTMIHTFTIANAGYTLAAGFTSITPSTVSLGVGIGFWDPNAQTCSLNQLQNNTATAGSTAISYADSNGSLKGSFCARVYNGGGITDPTVTVNYTLQIEHY